METIKKILSLFNVYFYTKDELDRIKSLMGNGHSSSNIGIANSLLTNPSKFNMSPFQYTIFILTIVFIILIVGYIKLIGNIPNEVIYSYITSYSVLLGICLIVKKYLTK